MKRFILAVFALFLICCTVHAAQVTISNQTLSGGDYSWDDARGDINDNFDELYTDKHVAATIGTANGLSFATQVLSLAAATNSTAGAATAAQITNLEALITLSGLAGGSTTLGTFTGATITDSVTTKTALQELETAVELRVLTTLAAPWDAGSYGITATQFTSDIATGTAPLVVASTTVVTNLNADTVDGESADAFQDADADLTTYAGITPSANIQTLLGAATYAAMRTQLDLEAGTDFYSMTAADTAFESELTNSAGLLAALSDETGTGLAVFNNSPTLITPTLGTITSGVGTALTALNGENIQDDTIDDDSIDWSDVTSTDMTFDVDTVPTTAVYSGTTSLEEATAADDSGAYIIGIFDEFTNSSSSTVQGVINDLDAAMAVGPASSTDNALVRYDTTTGKLLQNSVVTVGDTGDLSTAGNVSASQITSTVSVGTSPLTVTSTTAVTNLNADLLDGNEASAFEPVNAALLENTGTPLINQIGLFASATTVGGNSDFTFDGTNVILEGGMEINGDGNNASMRLYNDEIGAVPDTDLARIKFWGLDSVGGVAKYAEITAVIGNSTDGSEEGYLQFKTMNTTRMTIDTNGNVGIGVVPTANMGGLSIEDGLITLKETTTPTADTDYGKIYFKADNRVYAQDGAGVEKLVSAGTSVTGIGLVDTTGTFAAPITGNPYTLAAANAYNAVLYYGATGEIDLPAGVDGMEVLVYNTGAYTVTIDPNGSEPIVREGTLQTGGVSMTLSSGAGNYVKMVFDGTEWVTLDSVGTLGAGS